MNHLTETGERWVNVPKGSRDKTLNVMGRVGPEQEKHTSSEGF